MSKLSIFPELPRATHFRATRTGQAKKLLICGEFGNKVFFLIKDPAFLSEHFPGLLGLEIQELSSDEFSTLSLQNDNELTLLLLGKNVTLKQRSQLGERCFIIASNERSLADVYIDNGLTEKSLLSAVSMGFEFLANRHYIGQLNQEIKILAEERKELGEIGVALSAERDLDKLLSTILQEGRKLGRCEAASLYLLLNPKSDNPELLFKLTQNSEINFDFKEVHFPLTNKSLAGYVALTGEILNIADAHDLATTLPYTFDKSFDEKTGYRTRQMLVMPMRNHKGNIIGVLQFINNKDANPIEGLPLGFSQERQDILFSLASQSAVAIDNSQLIDNIQCLFEGFVAASVKAIESRDPVTSGHSFRVAEYTTGLAETLDRLDQGIYRNTFFNKQQLQEIRYASLLHDFGKVGVKENVLLNANKLEDERLQYLDLKIEWQKQLVQRRFYQQLLNAGQTQLPSQWQSSDDYFEMQKKLEQLSNYQKILMQANRPSLLEAAVANELRLLFEYELDESFPHSRSLLHEKDFLALSVTKGSLTEEERLEIQSHVIHTQEFLMAIPWTEELSQIPLIAGSHHEKLDGSGYPCGLKDPDIPVASKIMAVADIYDALTARDRPYKKAVKTELALDILRDEAKHNKLCSVMVNTFIEAKVYQKIHND